MMPKVIDGTWKGEGSKKQIEIWEKENAGKPIRRGSRSALNIMQPLS
jgi:hypothetical protein